MTKGTKTSCRWEKVDDIEEWMSTFRGREKVVPADSFSENAWNINVGADAGLFDITGGFGRNTFFAKKPHQHLCGVVTLAHIRPFFFHPLC